MRGGCQITLFLLTEGFGYTNKVWIMNTQSSVYFLLTAVVDLSRDL